MNEAKEARKIAERLMKNSYVLNVATGLKPVLEYNLDLIETQWQKRKELNLVSIKKNNWASISINKGKTRVRLWVDTIISPKNYNYDKVTYVEYGTTRGNTLLGGKIVNIFIEKYGTVITFEKTNASISKYTDMHQLNSRTVITKMNKFMKNSPIIEKKVEFLIKDIKKHPKKYKKVIAYG